MGRNKEFFKDSEVTEDAYTKAYPQYFKKIGEISGYNSFLATPVFIPDPIKEFVEKEEERQKEKITEENINDVAEVIEDFIENIADVDVDRKDIKDILVAEETEVEIELSDFDEEDVKIETEE